MPVGARWALPLHHGPRQVLERIERRAPGPDEKTEVVPRGGDLHRFVVEEVGLDGGGHPVLTQQAGQERSAHLTLLFERHALGHGNCLLRFFGALRVLAPPRRAGRRRCSVHGDLGPATSTGPAAVAAAAGRTAGTRAGLLRGTLRRGPHFVPTAGRPRAGITPTLTPLATPGAVPGTFPFWVGPPRAAHVPVREPRPAYDRKALSWAPSRR